MQSTSSLKTWLLCTSPDYHTFKLVSTEHAPTSYRPGLFVSYGWPRPRMGGCGGDTSGCATQVKTLDIFRSKEKGNCLRSVGRWGLVNQALRSFSALKPLKWAFYRGFRAGDSGIFVKKRPKLPLSEMTIRGPER